MKWFSIPVLVLAVTLMVESPSQAQRRRGGSSAARNGWLFSLTEGKRIAQQTGKPLMVVFRCEP